jgi:hypothetical protein
MISQIQPDIEIPSKKNISVCNELRTLKYKSMMLNGVKWPESKASFNLDNLDKFLENEKINNSNEPWSKLDKTGKLKKLIVFAEAYKLTNELSDCEYNLLVTFFKDCLDKKKLHRVKDVSYNKDTGEIKEIPALFFNKVSKHFTLKNADKHVSTIRGLAPKKKQGTAKNVHVDSGSDTEC